MGAIGGRGVMRDIPILMLFVAAFYGLGLGLGLDPLSMIAGTSLGVTAMVAALLGREVRK